MIEQLLNGKADPPRHVSMGVKAAANIRKAYMVAPDATGFAVEVTATTGLKSPGVALHLADNTAGSDGARDVDVAYGVYRHAILAGDEVTVADVFAKVFGADGLTVARTDAGGTRSAVGVLLGVEGNEAIVWHTPALGLLA